MKWSALLTFSVVSIVAIGATCFHDGSPVADGVVPIANVQGEGHRSPLIGDSITIEGAVTAVRSGPRVPGFWIQDSAGGLSTASSGVFVRTESAPDVVAGQIVRARGLVREYEREGSLPLTQIDAASVEVRSVRGPTPEAVRIGAGGLTIPEVIDDDGLRNYQPSEDAIDFWESLEGMLVEIERPMVVGPTSGFGDFVVVPVTEGANVVRTERGGILLRPSDENSERIIVDTGLLNEKADVSVGDTFRGSLSGVVHYDFGNYRLMATSLPATSPAGVVDSELPRTTATTLRIGSYNVLNLSAADKAERFQSVAGSIVRDLGSPDVIGLQEIQDDTGRKDDGTVSGETTLRRLTESIMEAGGPAYVWRQIDPLDNADGGAPGSNIRVAYLLNPERVEIIDRGEGGPTDEARIEGSGEAVHLSLSPGRIGTASPCFLGSGSSDESEGTRKSLALEIRFQGKTYFLVNNHLKSKRGDDSPFGPSQPPVRHTEEKRFCQAALVAELVAEILERHPRSRIVVMGDMNEHEFRAPMKVFSDAGLVNMVDRVPLGQRYTYNYLGNSQVLDHILVSPEIAGDSRLVIAHVNSVVPASEAASDHDPLLLMIPD